MVSVDDGVDPVCFSAACFWSSGARATYAVCVSVRVFGRRK